MVRTTAILIAFAIAISVVGVPADAATVVVEIPVITDFETYRVTLDLQGPVGRINWIYVQASGATTYSQLTSFPRYFGHPDCANPTFVPRDFIIGIDSDQGPWFDRRWIMRPDGAFAIADTLYPSDYGIGVPPGGNSELYIVDGRLVSDWIMAQCGFEHIERACQVCEYGHTVFETYPTVTIDYEPAVPNTVDSWGSIKARYR